MSIEKHGLIRATQRTGKIDKAMTSLGSALLQMWALQNTTSTKVSYVFNLETGDVVMVATGMKGRDFPEVEKNPTLNIEDICPGICLALNEEGEDQ